MTSARPASAVLALAALSLAGSAFAGYTATTKPYLPTVTDATPTVGDIYRTTTGFSSWVGDTASDLAFPGAPNASLFLRLDASVVSTTASSATYTGSFSVIMTEGIRAGYYEYYLGSGDYTFTATTDASGGRTISGSMLQTQGRPIYQQSAAMPDIGERYARNPMVLSGTIAPSGQTVLTIRQNAVGVVPEPATLAALGLGAAALLRRRRR